MANLEYNRDIPTVKRKEQSNVTEIFREDNLKNGSDFFIIDKGTQLSACACSHDTATFIKYQ